MSTLPLKRPGWCYRDAVQEYQMVEQNFVHLWDVGENKKEWMEGKETQKRNKPIPQRINIFICFLENVANFPPRTCFLQGFALHATGCFKEFSGFTFGCTMRRLLPDA